MLNGGSMIWGFCVYFVYMIPLETDVLRKHRFQKYNKHTDIRHLFKSIFAWQNCYIKLDCSRLYSMANIHFFSNEGMHIQKTLFLFSLVATSLATPVLMVYDSCEVTLNWPSGLWEFIIRPPDKTAYLKIIIFISEAKHMLWVLKRTVSMRQFFWAPKTHVKTDG